MAWSTALVLRACVTQQARVDGVTQRFSKQTGILFLLSMGVVCMWTCKCGTQGGQLELKAVVSHPERVLRTELRSAKRPVSAPNC